MSDSNLKQGDIVSIGIWCDRCSASHSIPIEDIIIAAATGESDLINRIGVQLIGTAKALAGALAIAYICGQAQQENSIINLFHNTSGELN